MANKPFEIQGSTLTIGGVDLQAGNTGVVIPGVTRATNYNVEEVEDTGDQTQTFAPDHSGIIDHVTYTKLSAAVDPATLVDLISQYSTSYDEEGYIDNIESNGAGSYTSQEATDNESNNMWAYVGSDTDPITNFVPTDWIQIPFRPKMRAGEIETIGGGGIGNLTMDTPWLILSQDSTNFIDFANAGQMRLAGGEGNQVQIISNYGTANTQHWNFNPDGTMNFPDGTQQVTAYNPQVVPGLNNHNGYNNSDDNTTTIKVVVPAQSIVVLALAAENANGQSINVNSVSGAGFMWTLRTRYTDPDSPVHQTGELWYAVNTGDSAMSGTVTIVYENAFDDQTSTYAVFGQVNLDNPWTNSSSVGVSTIDGSNYPTATYSTQEANTIALAFIATSVSTNRTKPAGFTLIESRQNSGAEYWEYSTLSYKINDTVQTDTVLTGEDTIELIPNGESNARGYTFIVDALRLTAPIATSVSALSNNGYTVSLDSNGVIHLPVGGDIVDSHGASVLGGGSGTGAQLVGDGYVEGTGSKVTVYSNYQGYQGGESNSLLIESFRISSFATGDTITFRNGEVRTITTFNNSDWGDNTYIEWNDSVNGDSFNNPRYPVTFTSATYIPDTKLTARIKPDLSTEGSGQFMDVYVGGSQVLDHKHVHMAGHEADTELFLGTDNNFISTKEAGRSPAQVNLKSENDITVSDTNLRMTRGNTWISVYGDGENRDWRNYSQDLSWDLVETDDQGNYYVGGESHWGPEAMVGKYGPDGDLIWKKIVNSQNTGAWNIGGAAYNPVDKEIAFAFETNLSRNHDYAKVTVFDSDTGDFKRTFDVFDPDGNIYVRAMNWHQTLGFMAVGNTSGETGTTGTLTSIGATGTGIIELPRTSVKINGQWPQFWSNWYISGTGINGTQTIQGGVGLYYAPVINLTNPSSTGMTAGIRVDYASNYYENYSSGTPGTGTWNNGDNFKILGSNLGGIDGDTTVVATPNSLTPHDGIVSMYFTKTTYPDLYNQLQACSWVAGYNSGGPYNIIGVANAGDNWQVDINSVDTTIDAVSFYTASGNDITGLIADANGIQNGFSGTPSPVAVYRIDMGYNMGYGSTDFTGGAFEITTTLNNTAFVWCNSWSKVFEAENGGASYAYSMAVDRAWGDVIVGGNENGTNRNFVWKLDAAGATQWVKRIDDDYNNNVTSVAVSSVNRSVYFTTNYTSINKLDMSGNFVKRVHPDGMWGFNNAIVKLEQSIDGEEYLYMGGGYGAIWTNGNSFMVSKLNSNLELMWTRSIRNSNRSLDTHYDSFHNNFVLGRDRAVLAGYTYFGSPNWDNAFLASISTGDNFDTVQIGNWYLDVIGNDVRYTDQTANYAVENCLVNGATTTNSTLQLDTNPGDLYLTNWTWKSALVKLDTTLNGIVGVESIAFAEGGVLDHNPSDIPPVVTDFSQTGWNYTLQLSDRGKFITNGKGIENYTGNLYITVPSNLNLTFPVGSVITLINISDVNSNNNRIFVQPENFSSNDCPRIYATGFGTTWSTWSFPGIQTATLMKIGSNEWLLTANNIQDEN